MLSKLTNAAPLKPIEMNDQLISTEGKLSLSSNHIACDVYSYEEGILSSGEITDLTILMNPVILLKYATARITMLIVRCRAMQNYGINPIIYAMKFHASTLEIKYAI